MTNLTLVHPSTVDQVAPVVRPFLERVIQKTQADKHRVTDVLNRVKTGQAQLWASTEGTELRAVAVTEIIIYPLKRVLRYWLLSGLEMPSTEEQDTIENWAMNVYGTTEVEAIVRRGFVKKLKERGFHEAGVVMTRPIERAIH